jgi:hypothetical protein
MGCPHLKKRTKASRKKIIVYKNRKTSRNKIIFYIKRKASSKMIILNFHKTEKHQDRR